MLRYCFLFSLPGIFIAIPRLINLLLPDSSEELRARVSRIAIGQTLVMVLLMSLAGTVLAERTGLTAALLDAFLVGQPVLASLQKMILPVLLYTLGGLIVFLALYYVVVAKFLDETTLLAMRKMRAALRLDGCILYAVAEEILARWGLMNVIAFFSILFFARKDSAIMWGAIFVSGAFYALGQLPAYLAAGCQLSRRFIYLALLLFLWQAAVFGWIFWQYGILAAIVSHMLFHLGWTLYDRLR